MDRGQAQKSDERGTRRTSKVKRGQRKTWAKGGKRLERPVRRSNSSIIIIIIIIHYSFLPPSTLSFLHPPSPSSSLSSILSSSHQLHLQLLHLTCLPIPLSTSSVSRTTVSIPDSGEPQAGACFPSHPNLSHSGADGSLLVWSNIHKELAFIQLSPEVSVKTLKSPRQVRNA